MVLKSIKSQKELDNVEIKSYKDAIKAKCYDCCCYDFTEVRLCQAFSCPLWAFRLGKKPKESRVEMTAKAKADFHKKNDA